MTQARDLPNQNQMELGYSPNNLRYLRQSYGLTQKDVAQIVGCKDPRQIGRWEADTSNHTHMDMPHAKWQILKNYLKIKEQDMTMTVAVLDLGVPNMRRVVSGSLANSLKLDWTKPLSELQQDVELALDALSRTQGFFKNLMMFATKNVRVYRGGNHIDIVDDGKGSLNWLFVGDNYVDDIE